MSIRIRALVEYDGTDYAGFQRQVHRPTIQAEIESVLQRLTSVRTRVTGAGRTDAGVHAAGQVIAFQTAWRHSLDELQRGMNALLPPAIAVKELGVAADGFHPRFDAVSRRYRYTILNEPVRSPLWERYAYHVSQPLNMEPMQAATSALVGVHDFATFGRPTQGESTVRELYEIIWRRDGSLISVDLEANGFLRHMVRCIVGTALQVGLGEIGVPQFVERFEARDRARSGPPAPPQGLCLTAVRYGGCAGRSSD